MKKFVFSFLGILIGFSAFASQLYIKTNTPENKINIALEAKEYLADKPYNLDFAVKSPLGNNIGARIIYKPETSLFTTGLFFIFYIKNAYFSDNLAKCWLVFYEHKGVDNDNDGEGDTSYDLNNDLDTNDSYLIAESLKIRKSEILFRVTDYKGIRYKSLHPNSLLYLACAEINESFVGEQQRDFSDPPAQHEDKYNLVLNLKSSSPIILRNNGQNCVCIEVIEAFTCCPMKHVDDLATKKECVIEFKNQFSIDMNPSVSFINSYPQTQNTSCKTSENGLIKCVESNSSVLKGFVDEPSGSILISDSCTDPFSSSGTIVIRNNPDNDIQDCIHLKADGWRGKLEVKLYDVNNIYTCDNSDTGYKALDFKDRMFIDNNGNPNSNAPGDPINKRGKNDIPLKPGKECRSLVNVYEEGSPSSNTIIVPQASTWEDDVYVGVNGKEYLKMVRWGLSLNFEIYDDKGNLAYSYSLKESDKAVLDKINDCCYDNDFGGYFLLWKPNGDEAYIPYMLNLNQFRVIVSNNSCWDAEIYARVWDSKGHVVDNVYIGTVGANSSKLLFGDEIFKKAQAENPELGQGASPLYSVILTVGAPKRDVEFAAYDNRAGKTKMVPVYDLNAHDFTYRNVEFNTDAFKK
ncbi:MAG: hypothetical protein GXO21_03830 [Aquificae bacterium]|nr:hypothetical protein [Aquificota bacterium]